jgi:hypothetical protein
MPLSKQELLAPRYKVIEPYPFQSYNVGDIITGEQAIVTSIYEMRYSYTKLGDYPAIFKPLRWFEERELSELPEYVSAKASIHKTVIHKIVIKVKWQIAKEDDGKEGLFAYDVNSVAKIYPWGLEPADQTDFDNQNKQ